MPSEENQLSPTAAMTTFTRISDDETPVIEVSPDRKLSKIDPMIYGGFTE